jgi:hypothetical protein
MPSNPISDGRQSDSTPGVILTTSGSCPARPNISSPLVMRVQVSATGSKSADVARGFSHHARSTTIKPTRFARNWRSLPPQENVPGDSTLKIAVIDLGSPIEMTDRGVDLTFVRTNDTLTSAATNCPVLMGKRLLPNSSGCRTVSDLCLQRQRPIYCDI